MYIRDVLNHNRGLETELTACCIDLVKAVFEVSGVDLRGKGPCISDFKVRRTPFFMKEL